MKLIRTIACESSEEYFLTFEFLLRTKRIADPLFKTAFAYGIFLRTLRNGTILRFENEHKAIIGMVAYTYGTPYDDYEERHIAYVEYCLSDPSMHGTYFFLQCLQVLVQRIMEENTEATEFMLVAEKSNTRNNRLYSKFAKMRGVMPGAREEVNLYSTSIRELSHFLAKFR